ncbi:MAG: hypothetical protein WEB85_14235 [Dongiaceae bacterium]
MTEIRKEHVEWAVVDRLRTILERTSQDEFEVTHAFALFSAICGWVRQHLGAFGSESEWPKGLEKLCLPITCREWGLPGNAAYGAAEIWPFSGAPKVKMDLSACTAWQFLVWIRNAMAHGDARSVQPIHEEVEKCAPNRRLTGFRFESNGCRADLTGRDMRVLGIKFAELFCNGFSKDELFKADAKNHVSERAA